MAVKRKLTTYNRLDLEKQLQVLRRIRNYDTIAENLRLLETVDPICSVKQNGVVVLIGQNVELFKFASRT